MATAGTPPITIPSIARATSKPDQLGVTAVAMLHKAASNREQNIMPRRPSACEKALAMRIEKASMPVVNDSESELSAGLTPNERAKAGSKG